MDERILEHLKRLNKYYLHLLDFKKLSADYRIIQENVEDFKLFQDKIVAKLKSLNSQRS